MKQDKIKNRIKDEKIGCCNAQTYILLFGIFECTVLIDVLRQ